MNKLPRSKRRPALLALSVLAALAMAVVTAVAVASSSSVSVADVDAPTGSVTLAPGATGPITLQVTVTGAQAGNATFKVYRDWTLSDGAWSGSNPQQFSVSGPRAGSTPAAVYSATGTVHVDAGHADGSFPLTVQAFDITNSNATGAKLSAGSAGNYAVTVQSPPPSDTQAPQNVSIAVDGGATWTHEANGDVSLALSATDNVGIASYRLATSEAGLAEASPVTVSPAVASFTNSVSPFALGGSEGVAKEVWLEACDALGNCTADKDTINWDKTAPSVTPSVTSSVAYTDGFGTEWYKDSASVNWGASDPLLADGNPGSGVVSGPTPPSSSFGEGFGQSGSSEAADEAGNTGTGSVSGINVDASGPDITALITSTPAYNDGTSDWYKDSVAIGVDASDPSLGDGHAGSGLASDPTGTYTRMFSGTFGASAEDNVGHQATASVSYNIDSQAPAVELSCPTTVVLGGSAEGSWTASDESGGSGLATPSSGSVQLETSTVGRQTAELPAGTASDNVGHDTAEATCTYSVVYEFEGFYSPVNNNGVLNGTKAGQAIPLKWRLLDANDNPVTDLSSVTVTVKSLSCGLGTTNDLLEEYAAGSSGLQNLGNGYYQFNWKSPSTYAYSCKTLYLDLGDGSPRTALFKFTK